MLSYNNITIDTVSEKAGVSKTTVSRYLNEKYEHMSEETKLRIKNVIEELEYRPNIVARNLKSKKTGLIGVILSDVANPVAVHLIKGVIDHCTQEGYQVVTASSDEKSSKEKEYILSMVDRQVEGLIVNTVDYNDYSLLKSLKSKGVSIVLADRTINENSLDMVTTDNYAITRTTIKTLYNMGFDVVALFSSNLLKSNVRLLRYNAFLDESKTYVPNPEKLAYILHEDVEGQHQYKCALDDFVQKNIGKKMAVFASTPMALLNVLNAAHELKLIIPRDLGVCGYDNLNWTKLISGGISVVEQPFYEVGVESAKILIQRIRGEISETAKYIELKSRLILRNSTNMENMTNMIYKCEK